MPEDFLNLLKDLKYKLITTNVNTKVDTLMEILPSKKLKENFLYTREQVSVLLYDIFEDNEGV